ncbi:MAG: HigA family addiction module antitoxin [Planctomycetota bacterium]|nr:HigA family addiction module antitoxin [Planctomycetota bacterium]
MSRRKLKTVTPGEILLEEFLNPLEISQYRLAKSLKVPSTRIAQIVKGNRAISAETALRLATFFGTTPQFWLNLQMEFDLRTAKKKHQKRVEQEVEVMAGSE